MKQRGLRVCLAAYTAAAAAAVLSSLLTIDAHPIAVAAVADVAATLVVFGFSRVYDNSSLYDPFWSVAPIPIAVYWAMTAPANADMYRLLSTIAMLSLWGNRLTFNWVRGWPGLHHEDWRYVDIRNKIGALYWPASLLGIHLFPTALVFGACLAVYPAVSSNTPFGALDVLAIVVCSAAVWCESTADKQLHTFVNRPGKRPGDTLETGLWGYSRHPNYFGEILFWWGLLLFGLSGDTQWWWTVVGPVLITLLFVFISVPMIDRRMKARRIDYESRMKRVSSIVPWFPRR